MDLDEYTSASIEDCVNSAITDLKQYKEDYQFRNLHERAEDFMKDLSFLSGTSYYTGESVIIYDNFPNTPDISAILLTFTKLTYSNYIDADVFKTFVANLSYVEVEHVQFRVANSYRCLKIVAMMMLYRSAVHASIVCRFILHQMGLSIGIR